MREIRITDIKGIKVGHAQDAAGGTGCTAIICEAGAAAGVDVRGGAPATRETDLLRTVNMIERIHAVVLSGGSAYGLDACSGVMRYLEERGAGFDAGAAVVPIVCGASLFDLHVGDPKRRPDSAMGYSACEAAGNCEPSEGNVGAGTGATVGKLYGPGRMMKSGVGIYAVQADAVQCAAVVAVNALGDVFDPEAGRWIAGLLSADGSGPALTAKAMHDEIEGGRDVFGGNTTIGCIVTNARLTKTRCSKLASVSHNGLARVIRPLHTSADGDAMFVMATGEVAAWADGLGELAAEVTAKAAARAALTAEAAYGLLAARDFAAV